MDENEKVCTVCQRPVSDWPMCFRGDDQCSVVCTKKAKEEPVPPVEPKPEVTMGADE